MFGIVRLFGTPKDVIDAEVFFAEINYLRNRYLLARFWIDMVVITVLNCESNRNVRRRSANERIAIIHLRLLVRQQIGASDTNAQLFCSVVDSAKISPGHEVGIDKYD